MTEDSDLSALREATRDRRVLWHLHSLERMLERGISRTEVLQAVSDGEVVEEYPEDRPFPSYLFMNVDQQPLHVVAATDPSAQVCHIITVYRPDTEHFGDDLKTRRRES